MRFGKMRATLANLIYPEAGQMIISMRRFSDRERAAINQERSIHAAYEEMASRYRRALTEIVEMETPKMASVGRRMIALARASLALSMETPNPSVELSSEIADRLAEQGRMMARSGRH